MPKETLCWYCKWAGQCKKPIPGWEAEENVVKSASGLYSREDISWTVIKCPNFLKDRDPVDGNEIQGNKIIFHQTKSEKSAHALAKTIIEINGAKKPACQVAIERGISIQTLYSRIRRGWDVKRAATKIPVNSLQTAIIGRNSKTGEVKRWKNVNDVVKDGFSRRIVIASCNETIGEHKGWTFFWDK